MEKPLCNAEEECVHLIETCKEQNIVLMCAHPVRYWLEIEKLKELVDSDEYAELYICRFGQNNSQYITTKLPGELHPVWEEVSFSVMVVIM